MEEIWYFLAGQGRVWRRDLDGAETVLEVGPGSRVLIPMDWAFQFAAGPDEALRFLCYTSPPWPGPDEAIAAGPGGLERLG